MEEEEIDISKTIESNIDYWRNKCFEQQKEIEYLIEKNKSIVYNYESVVDKLEESISKDKIKQLLKEKEKQYEIYVGREYSGMGELAAEIKILEKILGDQI